MFFANTIDNKHIYIDNAMPRGEYLCPICDAPLIQKRGEIRHPHFSHKPGQNCPDTWKSDMSDWHYDWQCRFPLDTREIVISHNNEKHRADVLIGKTVIEFQYSPISKAAFNERNQFYLSAGYNIVCTFVNDVRPPIEFVQGRVCC